jgi:hypothetical protein
MKQPTLYVIHVCYSLLRSAPHLSWLDLDNRKQSIFLGPFSNLRTSPLHSVEEEKTKQNIRKMFPVGVCVCL